MSSTISPSGYTDSYINGGPSKKIKSKEPNFGPPCTNTIIPSQLYCEMNLHVQLESYNPKNDRNRAVSKYPSSISLANIPIVKRIVSTTILRF